MAEMNPPADPELDHYTSLSDDELTRNAEDVFRTLDKFEMLVDYGIQQARTKAQRQGVDWDALSEEEREALVDVWLHEA